MSATAEKMEESFELVPFDGVQDNKLRGYSNEELVCEYRDNDNTIIRALCERLHIVNNDENAEIAELSGDLQDETTRADALEEHFDELKDGVTSLIDTILATNQGHHPEVKDSMKGLVARHDLECDLDFSGSL